MTVNFALLGAGRIGRVHAKAVSSNPDAKLVAVADAFPAAAQSIAAQYSAEVLARQQSTKRTLDAETKDAKWPGPIERKKWNRAWYLR